MFTMQVFGIFFFSTKLSIWPNNYFSLWQRISTCWTQKPDLEYYVFFFYSKTTNMLESLSIQIVNVEISIIN